MKLYASLVTFEESWQNLFQSKTWGLMRRWLCRCSCWGICLEALHGDEVGGCEWARCRRWSPPVSPCSNPSAQPQQWWRGGRRLLGAGTDCWSESFRSPWSTRLLSAVARQLLWEKVTSEQVLPTTQCKDEFRNLSGCVTEILTASRININFF